MRKKKLILNTITSLILQITIIISGFIIPRFILSAYGSEVNGLVQSVTNFLGVIAYLELGVGAVVQSALYKPLVKKDKDQISRIFVSATRFFHRLALILLIYVIILTFVYPLITHSNFSFLYTATLIIAMSISSFAQYYFGVANRLLLTADQKGYVQYLAQIITLILNTIACVILIKIGANIQIVKLTTSIIYLARPLALTIYVDKNYDINKKIHYIEEPIKQKWNGIAQHIAAIVLDNTDTLVLTILSTLNNVSIYSVYYMIVYGIKQLITSLTSGIQSLIGELWAKQELNNLKNLFGWAEWSIHTGVTFLFGCTSVLVVPFVQVYTRGINDTNYIVPSFALLITIAHALHGLRVPYHMLILAAGHYKQTQNNYIITTIINLLISIITVKMWGLVGVAVGTLMAMLYQTIWMAWYDSKFLLKWSFMNFFKQFLTDIITYVLAFLICTSLSITSINYFSWIIMAIKTSLIWIFVILFINLIIYPNYMKKLLRKIIFK